MNILQFLQIFAFWILISSWFIVGWYTITRGHYELQPDGSQKKVGNVFMGWSFFWEKINRYDRAYYDYAQSKEKFNYLKAVRPDVADKFVWDFGWHLHVPQELFTAVDQKIIEDTVNSRGVIEPKIINSEAGSRIIQEYRLYLEVPVYYFPWWVRYPLSECPICMSSVYGSLLWWLFVWFQVDAFSWTSSEKEAYFVFWIIFCITLSATNKFFNSKIT